MTISLTIPDAVAPRVVEALCSTYNYSGYSERETEAGRTPMTKAQFAKTCVGEFLRNTTKAYEAGVAMQTAKDSAVSKVDSEVSIS